MNYDWTVSIDGVNVSGLVKSGGTIDYGRPTRYTQFQAPMAQFTMFTEATFPNYGGAWPTVNLGDAVIIHVTWDGITQWRRFTGVVQALDWSVDGLRVTAAGTSADWPNLLADGLDTILSPYPIPVPDELETTRVQRFCDDAGVSITIEGVPARRVRGIPAGELPQPLLDSLLRVADDCDALLMEDRLGVVHYRTRNFDRPAPYTLPSTVVERDSIDMAYERGSHINAVRVFYGEPDATTGQQNYVYANDSSTYNTVAAGERLIELATDIRYDGGAEGKAAVYLEKNRLAWEVPDVTLIMNQATGVQADAILDLQENWMVEITSLPTGCPITSYSGDVLGFTEVMGETDYRIVLHLGPRIADTGSAPEEPIFEPDSITGGTTSTYEDEFGYLWQLHVWDDVGSYSATVNSTVTAEVAACAGGGGSGAYLYPGAEPNQTGAGGAGGTIVQEVAFTPGPLPIVIGDGGVGGVTSVAPFRGANGQDTVIGTLILPGGGGGAGSVNSSTGEGQTPGTGNDGGSGGGGAIGGTAGQGIAPYGHAGGVGGYLGGAQVGGGGGAGGPGDRGVAGPGVVSSITGTAVEYGRGGGGDWADGSLPGQGAGGGYNGSSQRNGSKGGKGTVRLRYRIG